MSDIDRNDPLWVELRRTALCMSNAENIDELYLIATRHRDEAITRYRADAERLDWVRTQKATVHPAAVGTAFKWFVVVWTLKIEGEGCTVEAAIDAAREQWIREEGGL